MPVATLACDRPQFQTHRSPAQPVNLGLSPCRFFMSEEKIWNAALQDLDTETWSRYFCQGVSAHLNMEELTESVMRSKEGKNCTDE